MSSKPSVNNNSTQASGWVPKDNTLAAINMPATMAQQAFNRMRPQWKLGDNPAWGSIVVDQAAAGWSTLYWPQWPCW